MKRTSQLSIAIVLLCLITLLFANVLTVKCVPNTAIDDYDCSEARYQEGTAYAAEIDYGLDELAYMTIDDPNYQKTLMGTYAVGFAYCQRHLSSDDCIACLEDAASFLREDCQFSYSAYVVMIDCGMRYGPRPTNK